MERVCPFARRWRRGPESRVRTRVFHHVMYLTRSKSVNHLCVKVLLKYGFYKRSRCGFMRIVVSDLIFIDICRVVTQGHLKKIIQNIMMEIINIFFDLVCYTYLICRELKTK